MWLHYNHQQMSVRPSVLLQFFHLVAAQGLRKAAASSPSACFEELLASMDAAVPIGNGRNAATPNTSSAAWQQPQCSLLRRPAVFTLAIVWDSPQAPSESIRGTVEALGSEVDLSGVFGTPLKGATSAAYKLRCVVCYFGHHYLVFAANEALGGTWLSFDDEEVAVVGGWAEVCRAMVARRLQPSLLFYEGSSPVAQ